MKTIAELISETSGCSVTPWPYDPTLRKIPEFIPPDIRSLAREFYQFHIFEEPTDKGTLTTPGSIHFYPDFDISVGDEVFLDQSDRTDPNFVGFLSCYTLAYLGIGNSRIILDLSGSIPVVRHFYYYIIEPLKDYPILDMEFSELIRVSIASGPDVSFYETLIWNDTKTKANTPWHATGDKPAK